MRGCLPGLLLIAACYTPAIPSEVPCSPSGECPDGWACAAGTCVVASGNRPDAAVGEDAGGGDAISVTDRDGDGVADTTDNCPAVANRDQANEDGDKFGDACDPCPQLSDNAAVDTDGDQIGDACDPNPTAHDTVWRFEGFHGGVPAWAGSVNWAPVGDSVRVTAAGDPAPANEYLVLPLTVPGRINFDNYSATMSVMVEQLGSGSDHEIGIELFDDTADRGIDCELAELNGNRFLWLVDDANLDKKVNFAWTNGAQYTLRFAHHGTNYTCDVTGPGGPVTASATSSIVPRTGADTDIWAYGVTAQLGSVSVVGSP